MYLYTDEKFQRELLKVIGGDPPSRMRYSAKDEKAYKQFMRQHAKFLRMSDKSTLNIDLEALSEPRLVVC